MGIYRRVRNSVIGCTEIFLFFPQNFEDFLRFFVIFFVIFWRVYEDFLSCEPLVGIYCIYDGVEGGENSTDRLVVADIKWAVQF